MFESQLHYRDAPIVHDEWCDAEYRKDGCVCADRLDREDEDEEGPPPDLNREGDPAFNGAFG